MQQPFDAMTQGIILGGLRNKNEIRVLLCYLLNSIGTEISKTGLNNIIQSTQLVNFFETNDSLSQMVESGLVSSVFHDGEEYFSLTPEGVEFAEKLDTLLPSYIREAVVNEAIGVVAREKMRGSVDVKTEKLEHGYHVILSVYDGDTVMMRTVLYAADAIQADAVGEKFLQNPEKLYTGIIDILTE